MASPTVEIQHQSAAVFPGAWKLPAGRAVTLQPGAAGQLGIAHGSVWVTRDGPHQGPLNDLGDRILQPGEKLSLQRGQRLVIETLDRCRPAYFNWDPLPLAAPARAADLAQSAADLRRAVALGAGAAGRLLAALAGLAWGWAEGDRRARVDPAFSAHSRACRAPGAMS
ncbi:MAG: DUF2917 domain-containing protein [Ramlibacter sp.]|nr:DUF2917 domain-containing protein [Ramlibacter sp.]